MSVGSQRSQESERSKPQEAYPHQDVLEGLVVLVDFHFLLERPETSLAFAVVDERLGEVVTAEIGPECGRDINFGVGELPEQEVAQAHLAAGADE